MNRDILRNEIMIKGGTIWRNEIKQTNSELPDQSVSLEDGYLIIITSNTEQTDLYSVNHDPLDKCVNQS